MSGVAAGAAGWFEAVWRNSGLFSGSVRKSANATTNASPSTVTTCASKS